MKQFIKYVLATVVGIVCVCLLFSVLSVVTLIGMASASGSGVTVSENSVLVVKLEGAIEERVQDNPFAKLLGSSALESQGLNQIIKAIKRAETEENVKGIYIESGTFAGAAPATLQAIRKQLVEFKKSGKFVLAYGDDYTQGAYYLSSVADSVVINPKGTLDWKGLAMSTMYFKDFLDKIGVKMQVYKVGTYKSAVEPYLLNEMSDANREQLTVLSSEIWNQFLTDISKDRKIGKDKLNALADSFMTFQPTEEYKKVKLVDKLAYSDEVPSILRYMTGVEEEDDYHTISVADLASLSESEPNNTSGNVIAVYYAQGDIVQESQTSGFNNEIQIVGKDVISDLKSLAEDEDVKAVVLRVNSGGGSAYASEQIWNQVMKIKAKKPIVASMGDYAASGGYYISCAADWIIAEPTTLTGSIGIFGMIPEASELMNKKLGLHTYTVKTNTHSDFGASIDRPFTEAESAKMQAYINKGYDLFTRRCADGRKMKQDAIKAVAEGRVWTGEHAKKLGLVDQLGGLDDAIAKAKKLAKVEEYTVLEYPGQSSIFDNLMNQVSSGSYADAMMEQELGEYYEMFSKMKSIKNKTGVQASLPYYFMFNL